MFIGVGTSVPEISNLPGSSRPGGGGGSAFEYTAIDNSFSMEFDGTSYVNAGNSLNFVTSNHALSMWIKTNVNSNLVICEKGPNDELAIQTIFSEIRWAGTNSFDTSGANINNGNWHHLAVVADGSSSFIYVDGILNATGGNKIQASSNTSNFNIGSRAGIVGVVGNIDEVAIWNSAISEETIQAIYNTTANNPGKVADLSETPEGAPVAWYRMGD